jgi:hypothetical protein
MKTSLGLLLTILVLLAGCAPGYYAKGPAYQEAASAPAMTGMWFQNPETESQEETRIWHEEAGR